MKKTKVLLKQSNIIKDKNGHAEIKQIEDETYTVYQLVPGESVGITNYDDDVPAAYTQLARVFGSEAGARL